jgi:hypothetical protein
MQWRRTWKTDLKLHTICLATGHSGSAVGLGTALQTWRSRIRLEFSIDINHPINSDSNRNEYQEYFLGGKGGRCVGLTSLPPSYANCLQIWGLNLLESYGPVRGLYRDCLTWTQDDHSYSLMGDWVSHPSSLYIHFNYEFSYLATHMNNEKPLSRFVRLSKSVTLLWLILSNICLFSQSVGEHSVLNDDEQVNWLTNWMPPCRLITGKSKNILGFKGGTRWRCW